MSQNKQQISDFPIVDWQSNAGEAFKLFRLESKHNRKPSDGHDPGVPHRIGFHALFLVTGEGFDHWLDFEIHQLKKNHLMYIAPNQIHHFLKSERPKNSWVLIFQPELLPDGLLSSATNHEPSWSVVSFLWPSLTQLQKSEADLLCHQLSLISLLADSSMGCQSAAAIHHVCGFITSAFDIASKNVKVPTTWQKNERFFQFIQLVERHFRNHRDVKWYAKQIDCSDRTLNRACQDNTGNSAKEILTSRLIVEAKRNLIHCGTPINLVAEELGFHEPTNFVRLFRHETGITPLAFRELNANHSSRKTPPA